MAVVTNRNQDSFETIEGISGRAQKFVKQAAKAAGDTVVAMAGDAKQQITGDFGTDLEQAQAQQKIMSQQQQQQVADQSQQALSQARQNLEKLNAEIDKIRQEKVQKKQQEEKKEDNKKEQKKEMKKQEDEREPVWKKMLKKGSHESQSKGGG
jgi:TPP-dependent 2-oxoacid decarboxylase